MAVICQVAQTRTAAELLHLNAESTVWFGGRGRHFSIAFRSVEILREHSHEDVPHRITMLGVFFLSAPDPTIPSNEQSHLMEL